MTDEQMIAEIAKAIAADIALQDGCDWTPPDHWEYRFAYLDQGEVDFKQVARAAHSVMAGKVVELEGALQFYARENNWRSSTVYMCGHGDINCNVMGDKGAKARAALAPYPERRSE